MPPIDFDKEISAILAATMPRSADEPVKTASDSADTTLSQQATDLAADLEKIASLPVLASYEAAQRATPRSVQASNKGIGNILRHTPKAPELHVKALATAKLAEDGQAARLRDVLLAQLRSKGVQADGSVSQEKAATAAGDDAEDDVALDDLLADFAGTGGGEGPGTDEPTAAPQVPPAVVDVVKQVKTAADAVRSLATGIEDMEQRLAALQAENADLTQQARAFQIAKTAAERGFIEPDALGDYAQSLLDEPDADLEKMANEFASTRRVGLGGPSQRSTSSPANAEDRLQSRLLRNASTH